MKFIRNFEEFKKEIEEKENKANITHDKVLAGIVKPEDVETDDSYYIQITFNFEGILFEHETYTFFKNTNNRYLYHTERTNPPVEAHYHIYPAKGKNELYSVNITGKAHHKKNRGYEVPRKEANELRALGVNIPENNIIESVDEIESSDSKLLLETIDNKCFCAFVKIEG